MNNKKPLKFLLGVVAAMALVVSPMTASAVTLSSELDLGDSGSQVTLLQQFLAGSTGIYPEGLVTGYFGSLTQAAVRRLQTAYGISAVGRVGPQTLAAINARINGSGQTVGTHKQSPVIGPVSISTTNTTASLSWNTDEPSSALVYYGTSPLASLEANSMSGVTIYGTSAMVNIAMSNSHSATISGLQSNMPYYYIVYVRDSSGNESVSSQGTFRTNN